MKNSQNNDPNWINLKCGNLQLQGNATTLCSAGCILALASLAVYKGFLWTTSGYLLKANQNKQYAEAKIWQ